MPEYTVSWKIDIDADSPEEAARKALEIQRDPESIATVFQVTWVEKGRIYTDRVDLLEEPEEM